MVELKMKKEQNILFLAGKIFLIKKFDFKVL